MNKDDLILEYIANRTEEGDSFTNLGDLEIQRNSLRNLPINYVFNGKDKLVDAIEHVITMYYEDELKDWEACGKPENHIFNDLETLKSLI